MCRVSLVLDMVEYPEEEREGVDTETVCTGSGRCFEGGE
jgi:hypothetical protein